MKVGIISFAHEGHAANYAACLARMPDVELAAIADEDPERGRQATRRFGGAYVQDYRDLLARDDISAVVVTSANAQHREHVVAAARAGKHVLCEKPIATTRGDALEMIAVCRQNGVKLQTAFPVRFSPAAVALREAVRGGTIGTPLAINATNPGRKPPGWFGDPSLSGGGAVMDHTVHVADLLRWIFDSEITEVYAEVDTRIHPGAAVDDVGLLLLRLQNGLFASLDASWSRPETWPTWGGLTMEVIGDQGVIFMDAFNQNLHLYDDHAASYRLIPWADGGEPGLIAAFIAAVRDDLEPPVTGEDGLKAMEVALCAYESAKRQQPVACPEILLDNDSFREGDPS